MEEKGSEMKSLVAYQRIRDIIISREKLPGTRLVLSELEGEIGIGRGPIREALMRLDRSGLVKNIPYKGALVAESPKLKEVECIYAIRVNLEFTLSLEAMHNLDESGFQELDAILCRMENASQDEGYFSLDRQFHALLYEYSRLPHLCLVVSKLMESIEIFLSCCKYDSNDHARLNQEHRVILQALKEKDEALLKATLTRNIKNGLKIIKKIYSRFFVF
jgi:DNA-binding GntR family transcriptional regulator